MSQFKRRLTFCDLKIYKSEADEEIFTWVPTDKKFCLVVYAYEQMIMLVLNCGWNYTSQNPSIFWIFWW